MFYLIKEVGLQLWLCSSHHFIICQLFSGLTDKSMKCQRTLKSSSSKHPQGMSSNCLFSLKDITMSWTGKKSTSSQLKGLNLWIFCSFFCLNNWNNYQFLFSVAQVIDESTYYFSNKKKLNFSSVEYMSVKLSKLKWCYKNCLQYK